MSRRSDLLERGVWQAPWFGPNGELVLVAINSRHQIVGEPKTVPHGASRIDAADELLAQLRATDDVPMLRII